MLPVPEGALVIGEFVQDWNSIKDRIPCILVATDVISFKMVSNRSKKIELFVWNYLTLSIPPIL